MKNNKLHGIIFLGLSAFGIFMFFGFNSARPISKSGEKPRHHIFTTENQVRDEADEREQTVERSRTVARESSRKIASEESFTLLQTKNKLKAFSEIRLKTFRTPAEEVQVNEWASSPQLLQKISEMILDSVNPLSTVEADAAVDLLIEALKTGDQKFAVRTILAVIRDDQVESAVLSDLRRKELAAAKAQLMYHAVSIDAQMIEESLPGPVSRKIWQNVKQSQNQNLQQSANEKRAVITTRR